MATVVGHGGVSVTASGGHTGEVLASIAAIFNSTMPGVAPEFDMVDANATSLPAAPTDGMPQALIIPSGYTGSLVIPPGYTYVLYTGNGTLTGGDTSTVVIGSNLNYDGPAGTVLGTGGAGNVTDNTAGAMFSFIGGGYSLQGTGAGEKAYIDSSADGNVTLTGVNSTVVVGTQSINGGLAGQSSLTGGTNSILLSGLNDAALVLLGNNTLTSTGVNDVVAIKGTSNDLVFVTGTTVVNQTAGASTIVTGQGGTVTLNATGGSQIVFDSAGGNLINAGPSTEFVGALNAPSNTFISSAGGADTIFAVTGINYDGTAASSSLMLGGAAAATVLSAQNETLFGGSGGGVYTMGTGSFFFVAGGNASDTILGGAGSAQGVIVGNSNENIVASNPGAAKGNIFVPVFAGDTINAQADAAGNIFEVVNQNIGGGFNFTGNTTLIGSNAGSDQFALYVDSSNAGVHTIDVQNWQASDTMFVQNLDGSLSSADAASIANFLAGGSGNSFSLADGTTVEFTNTTATTFKIGHN